MRKRLLREFRPSLEQSEARWPPSAGALAQAAAGGPSTTDLPTDLSGNSGELADNQNGLTVRGVAAIPSARATGIQLDRVTNPSGQNAEFHPPFGHVLVQTRLPIPGQVYNTLFISLYNGSGTTFTASDNLTVRTSNSPSGQQFPILTGAQVWKPGGRIVIYVLSKKYYPFTPVTSAGFEFNFVSPRTTAIPGPSGIALRIRYNPATFDRILDYYVTSGTGARGHTFGLPDTAIWALYPPPAKTSTCDGEIGLDFGWTTVEGVGQTLFGRASDGEFELAPKRFGRNRS